MPDSKVGPHIGDGGGSWSWASSKLPRYAKLLDLNGISFVPQGVKIIWRQLRPDDGQILSEGRAGGQRLAREQLAALGGNLAKVWAIEGMNECISSNNPAQNRQAGEVALGHAETILAAGKVPIELNIAVGNVEQPDAQVLTPYFKQLWGMGAHVGYHSYFDQAGPDATWPFLAGRYQQITTWLRSFGVTEIPRWAITEGSWDIWGGNASSGPLWDLITKGRLSEASALVQIRRAYALLDADPLVSLVVFFTWFHQSTAAWRPYDLAVRPSGQPFAEMLALHGSYVAAPGSVYEPPPVQVPPPPAPPIYKTGDIVYVVTPPGVRLNVRSTPGGEVTGQLERGFRLTVLQMQGEWADVLVLYKDRLGVSLGEHYDWVHSAYVSKTPPSGADGLLEGVG